MGAPGSGKGTQSALLASRPGIECISTGTILRNEARRNTPGGFRLRQTMASGALVDDDSVCDAVASRIMLLNNDPESAEIVILDGFPRNVRQARKLDQLLAALEMPAPLVLHLDVSEDVLLRRLSRRRQCAECGAIYNLISGPSILGSFCEIDGGALLERDDDTQSIVNRRFETYRAETLPLVGYYCGRDDSSTIYRRIDGNRGAAEIANDVCDIVLCAATALAA
jgi:adenylate kinase